MEDAPPILITSAVSPPRAYHALSMQSPDLRLLTTRMGVYFFAGQGARKIAVVDSTGCEVLTPEDLACLRRVGVEIEQYAFRQDDDAVRERGLGYAEGRLLEFAITHATLIRSHKHFVKCSGKLCCLNTQNLIQVLRENHLTTMFWRRFPDQPGQVDTRLFYVAVEPFREHLLPSFLNSSYTDIVERLLAVKLDSMYTTARCPRPRLTGFSGGPGNQILGGKGYQLEEKHYGSLEAEWPCWFSKD